MSVIQLTTLSVFLGIYFVIGCILALRLCRRGMTALNSDVYDRVEETSNIRPSKGKIIPDQAMNSEDKKD